MQSRFLAVPFPPVQFARWPCSCGPQDKSLAHANLLQTHADQPRTGGSWHILMARLAPFKIESLLISRRVRGCQS